MTRFWMGSAAAVMAVSIAGVNAQSTGSQTPQTQTPASGQSMAATTTLKGCVYKEDAIPGRTPNVAEKAGVMEDYILVVGDHSATAPATGTATGSQTPTGTSGAVTAHKAFKLEKIADMTGFSSAQYLAGLFHRVVGMTPGSWRTNGRSRGTTTAAAS